MASGGGLVLGFLRWGAEGGLLMNRSIRPVFLVVETIKIVLHFGCTPFFIIFVGNVPLIANVDYKACQKVCNCNFLKVNLYFLKGLFSRLF